MFVTPSDSIQSVLSSMGADRTIQLSAGDFKLPLDDLVRDGFTVRGMGKGITNVIGGIKNSYSFWSKQITLKSFVLQDLTIDTQNVPKASGVRLYGAQGCRIERVEFKNTVDTWQLKIGDESGGICEGNKIIDCDFVNQTGTYEMLLLFNTNHTDVIRPTFRGKGPGPCFGLWQHANRTNIIAPRFVDNAGFCIYYSLSCEDIYIENLVAENSGGVLQGSNVSDNGDFGTIQSKHMRVINPRIYGGINSVHATAIELGAIDDVIVDNAFIENYEVGIKFHNGNSQCNAPATNWLIRDATIKDSNPLNNYHALHPGILFADIGGKMNGRIEGGRIYTTNGYQKYPIVFEGAHTWEGIVITAALEPAPMCTAIKCNSTAKYIV